MYKIKNTKNILVLLLSLVTSVSFAMEKKLNTDCEQDVICKIGPFKHDVIRISTGKISSKTAKKLLNSTGNKNNICFSANQVEILTVYDKKSISIWDLKQRKKIYEINKNIIKEKIDEATIKYDYIINISTIEKMGAPFLILHLTYLAYNKPNFEANICEYNIEINKLNLLSSSKNLDHHKKDLKGIRYATIGDCKVNHKDYMLTLQLKSKDPAQIIIEHKNPKKTIVIQDLHGDNLTIFSSPNKGSKYILLYNNTTHNLNLYNSHTGKHIKQIFNNSAQKGHLRLSFTGSIFSKNDNFITIMLGNHAFIYDLKNFKIVFHKIFYANNSEYLSTLAPLLTDDEKEILVPYNEYIYLYHNPLTQNQNEKKDQKERKKFLEEKFNDFKIKFIDDQTIDINKVFLLL